MKAFAAALPAAAGELLGMLAALPAVGVEPQRAAAKLSRTDVANLVHAAAEPERMTSAAWPQRDALLIMLLAAGMTSSEIHRLALDDVRTPDDGTLELYVVGRGARHRTLRFSSDYRRRWLLFVAERNEKLRRLPPAAFVRKDGGPVTPSVLRTVVARASTAVGLPATRPHDITYAARCVAVDSVVIEQVTAAAERLGLSSPRTILTT